MTQRRSVDVLLVRSAGTRGHRRHEKETAELLDELGYSVEQTDPDFRWGRLAGLLTPLNDLYQAFVIRACASNACRNVQPRVVIYTTAVGALLQPKSRLSTGVVRFDALCRENRPGWSGLWQRVAERRVLRQAAVLSPRSIQNVPRRTDLELLPLPPTITPACHSATDRSNQVIFYAGNNPFKKGLDVAVDAWTRAGTSGHELWVAGIDEQAGRRFLDAHGVVPSDSVRWAGVLEPAKFRQLVLTAAAYISASRYEDFGVAQIEAVVDGVPVISVPSEGPVEVLQILNRIAPDLVAASRSASSLSKTIENLFDWDATRRSEYVEAVADVVEDYSRNAAKARLRAVMATMQSSMAARSAT